MLHKVPAIAKGEGQHGHAHHRGLQGCRKGVSQNRDQQTQYTKDFFIETALRKGDITWQKGNFKKLSKSGKSAGRASAPGQPHRLTGFLYVFCRCSMHLSRR